MTLFEVLVPYLKGYYLTLNSWRSHCDDGGWKMTDKQWRRMWLDRFESGDVSGAELNVWLEGTDDDKNAPATVKVGRESAIGNCHGGECPGG